MNIMFQSLECIISIGAGQEGGFTDVPEAAFIKNMLAGFISTMFIPDRFTPECRSDEDGS
jgi:hypothetical protein